MAKKVMKFKFIDLFAGVGGMRLAFERAGAECVFSSEWDPHSQKTYEANFGEVPQGDITKIDAKMIPEFQILLAGFPCQPFSTIGKRQGFEHATQGPLFYDVLRILKKKNTPAFLLENVSGLISHDGGNTFSTIVASLESAGYKLSHKVLDSAEYGLPQHRRRIYIVGFKSKLFEKNPNFEWPKPNPRKVFINRFVETNVVGHSISKHLQKTYIYKIDDGRPQIIDKTTRIQVKTLVSTYHKIQRLTGTFVRDGETGLRLLTANECKAIMGFPKSFKMPVSRTQMYRQMGNSVAVPVVSAIAESMIHSMKRAKLKK